MRITSCLAAVATLLPSVLAQGAFVQNRCPFAVDYYGDYTNSGGSDVGGTINAFGGTYFENYVMHPGRSLKFWQYGQDQSNLLVWGYDYDQSTPFVW
jgi:hypothetical protein